MTSIVLQLQKQALDDRVRVADLLRHALAVASKLRLEEFESWINEELSGYESGSELPEYRRLQGRVHAMNPSRGWIPVMFESSEEEASANNYSCTQSVDEIESLLEGDATELLVVQFPANIQRQFNRGSRVQLEIYLHLSRSAMAHVLGSVRNTVLKWALQLEQDGVLGEDLTFSDGEKRAAGAPSYHNVTNFYGSVGASQIAQGSPHVVQIAVTPGLAADLHKLVEVVRGQLGQINLAPEVEAELKAELATIETQANSPKPKNTIVRETLQSLRRILESALGSSAAQLIPQIAELLARLGS